MKGIIEKYDLEKQFGFVRSIDNGELYFFRNDKMFNKLQGMKHSYRVYDEVEFLVRKSDKQAGKEEAYELVFIRNSKKEELVASFEKDGIIHGQIIITAEGYFIKPINSEVSLPLSVSPWEEFSDSSDSEIQQFKLINTKKIHKLSAEFIQKLYCEEYHELLNTTELNATIKGKNSAGFFAVVPGFETVRFFIECPELEFPEIFRSLRKGDTVRTKVKTINMGKIKQAQLEIVKNSI